MEVSLAVMTECLKLAKVLHLLLPRPRLAACWVTLVVGWVKVYRVFKHMGVSINGDTPILHGL